MAPGNSQFQVSFGKMSPVYQDTYPPFIMARLLLPHALSRRPTRAVLRHIRYPQFTD